MVKVRFTTIQFSDGTNVEVPESGVIVLVGPNNSGKSQTLRDLMGLSGRQGAYDGKAVSDITLEKAGSPGDIEEWIANHLSSVTQNGQEHFNIPGWAQVTADSISQQWRQPNLGVLSQLFIFHADATSRLTAGNSTKSIDFSTAFVQHPIQEAYRNGQLEHDIDQTSRDAFGLGISVDRYSGSAISLRVGESPAFEHDRGVPSRRYIQSLHAMSRLEEAGDGVRSYVGLLLHILGGSHQITLVDEPEAFLHPPQARRLGHVLAERAIEAQQVVMATHSADVVQGALDSQAEVTIIRITRDENVNNASVLRSESVRELWNDPLLRYSNMLDGLFHDAVVLCESDSDCRFYAAVLDALVENESTAPPASNRRQPQILFTHCGGKARMSSVVSALRAAGVPVVVVADFDVLKQSSDVERIIAALGGEFSAVSRSLNVVDSALRSEVRPVSKLALRETLENKLSEIVGESVSKSDMETLRTVMRAESGWDKAKRAGVNALPQGEASDTAENLLQTLKEAGLLVVPVGELERFVPRVSGHGPSWVTEVLRRNLHKSPDQAAVTFVRDIENAVLRLSALEPLAKS